MAWKCEERMNFANYLEKAQRHDFTEGYADGYLLYPRAPNSRSKVAYHRGFDAGRKDRNEAVAEEDEHHFDRIVNEPAMSLPRYMRYFAARVAFWRRET